MEKGDMIFNANIGAPHLFKGVVKLAVNSNTFKKHFSEHIEISDIRGLYPVAFRAEYGVNENFGIGINYSMWNIKFDVRDYYNSQNQSYGTIYKDSVDIYEMKIVSRSFGIRPNIHFPLDNFRNDIYIGIGLGITSNKLNVGFNSTDAGRFTTRFHKGLDYDLPLPGFIYIAPTIGYRRYVNQYFGFNFEFGYEKGALVQGGLVFRFHPNTEVRKKRSEQ
jgi:hypothetical protein